MKLLITFVGTFFGGLASSIVAVARLSGAEID